MAILKADNAALRSNSPSNKIDVTDQHARMRVFRDEITLSAELGAGDEIEFGGELFKGCKIHEVVLDTPILDTTSTDINVGFRANGSLSEDEDAFLDGVDAVSAKISKMSSTQGLAGQYLELEGDTQIFLTSVAATDAASGKKIQLAVYYTVD